MGDYIVKLLAASMLCAMVLQIVGTKSSYAGVVKLVCGVFITLAVVSPWFHFSVRPYDDFPADFTSMAQQAVNDGENSATQMLRGIISEQTRTYILHKAQSLGIQLEVDVLLSDGDLPTPCGVRLKGNISPYAKQVMSTYLTENLNIPSEEQQWIT